ncbi:MAG TPA: hypothetical protein VI542_26040 [Candidatus Tectomicrobia bacterium]
MTPTEEAHFIALWQQELSHEVMVQQLNIISQRDESGSDNTRTVVTMEAHAADAQIVGTTRVSLGWYRDWRESSAWRLPLGYRRARCDGAAVADGQKGSLP